MPSQPMFLGIHAYPQQNRLFAALLPLMPLILFIILWWIASAESNRFFPTFGQMWEAMVERIQPNEFTGVRKLPADILSSMHILLVGIFGGAVAGLCWGLYLGAYPGLRRMFEATTIFLSLAVVALFQPLIAKTVGFDTFGKICLVSFGTMFMVALGVFQSVKNIPNELRIKALTLGFNSWGLIHRIILPLVLPRWLLACRMALQVAWAYLIMSEFLVAEFGLGHEVVQNKRQLNMDVILPYGVIATTLAFIMDRLIYQAIRFFFPYFKLEG